MNYSKHVVALASYAVGVVLSSGPAAQTYAVNVESYYQYTIVPGLQFIGFHLTETNGVRSLEESLSAKSVPDGTVVFKLQAGTIQSTERATQNFTNFLASFPSHLQAPISIWAKADQIQLEWFGQIHEAAALTGPYNEITNAASPLAIEADANVRFWRALAPLTVSEESFSAAVVQDGRWSDPSMPVVHGEALILFCPLEEPLKAVAVGHVLIDDLTNAIPAGLSRRFSKLPKEGKITTDLKLRLLPGDHLSLLRNQELQHFIYQHGDSWFPEEPTLELGQGLMIYAHRPLVWEQHFDKP